MKNPLWTIGLLLYLAGFCFSTDSALADTMTDIKTRMKTRLPIIKTLKVQNIIGESNRGYLEFIRSERREQQVVNAENADRRKIYALIAQQSGTRLEVVEKHRAAQIHLKADPGEWLQDAKGHWYQK
jgi:hypothetical protein